MGFFSTEHLPTTVLPPRRITKYTVKPQAAGTNNFCPHCGTKYVEGKNFCVECGEKKAHVFTMDLNITKMKAIDFVAFFNDWLAQNPYIYNVRLSCDKRFMANDFNRLNQVTVSNVRVSFSVADQPLNVQYGVEFLYKYNASLNFRKYAEYSGKDLVAEWNALNPDCKVITYDGGRVTSDDGVYQFYQIVIFTKPTAPM